MSEQARWSRINLGGSIDALYAKCAPRVSIEPHWHEEFTVGLIDSGIVQLIHDGKTEHITTDKVVIVNAGEVHSADAFGTPSLRFRIVYIPESSFREVVSQGTKLPGSLQRLGTARVLGISSSGLLSAPLRRRSSYPIRLQRGPCFLCMGDREPTMKTSARPASLLALIRMLSELTGHGIARVCYFSRFHHLLQSVKICSYFLGREFSHQSERGAA